MNRFPLAALAKFTALALVVTLATAVLALTIANASGGDRLSYSARFTDATGLLAGDDVRIAGVVVGSVEDVEIVDRRVAKVSFSVDRSQALPASATAKILYKNLIGQRYLSLAQGAGATGADLPEGGTIPEDRTTPPLNLTTLFNGFKPLFSALDPQQVNQLSFEIVQVLQGEGGTVQSLIQHTASLTNTLADKDEVIGKVISNLNNVLEQINGRGDKLGTLITTTQQLVTGLASDAKPIGEALDSLSSLATSTSSLLQGGREPLRRDIEALGALSKTLADNSPAFDKFISMLPTKYETIGRTVSYGSWMNLYLCGATTNVKPAPQLPGTQPLPVGIPVTDARCGR